MRAAPAPFACGGFGVSSRSEVSGEDVLSMPPACSFRTCTPHDCNVHTEIPRRQSGGQTWPHAYHRRNSFIATLERQTLATGNKSQSDAFCSRTSKATNIHSLKRDSRPNICTIETCPMFRSSTANKRHLCASN